MHEDGPPPIEGRCDPRFERVREAFAENFVTRGEVGAAVCVVVDDVVVSDLWGGWADGARRSAWGHDTLVNVFSVGKPLAVLCVLSLVGEGILDLDAPVARHWPEFAAADKGAVTLRELLSHQAGLPAVRDPLPLGAMLDWDLMCTTLARHRPWWEPGTGHGYHVNTFGFLVGEIVRRVSGDSVGAMLRDRITGPLGADVHIGLPSSEDGRVAEFLWPKDWGGEAEPGGLSDDELMAHNAYFNPIGLSGTGVVNTRAWRGAEIPSTNGHGTARGVARIFQALTTGGVADGVRIVERAVLDAAVAQAVSGHDRVLHRPSRFGLGFQLTQPERPLGPSPRAFGHFGAGGSLGFSDPDAGVAFGYVINRMGPRWQNPLNRALIDAVYDSLGTR